MAAVALLVRCVALQSGSGQTIPPGSIVYNNYDFTSGQPVAQLSAINSDGTGDQRIAVNLPEPGFPVWSKDGQLLAFSSGDPARPFKISRDVFIFDPQTAQVNRLTSFSDTVRSYDANVGGTIQHRVDTSYVFPWFKAFSPDSRKIAIASYQNSGDTTSQGYTDAATGGQFAVPNDLLTGFQTVPALQVYSVDGAAGAFVAVGGGADLHGGDGVDWAPNTNLLVWPKTISVNVGGINMPGPVTALYLMEPVADAVGTGHARQLTFPLALSGFFSTGSYIAWQTDFQPAFSPDGKRVAYVRAFSLTVQGFPGYKSQPSLMIANVGDTNNVEIKRFNLSDYITHVSWSPDGARLIFDLGPQAIGPAGFPYLAAVPSSNALYTINLDGTDQKKLRHAPAGWPAWSPLLPSPAAPHLTITRSNPNQLVIAWPATTGTAVLEATDRLGSQANWQPVSTSPVPVSGQQSLSVSPAVNAQFYRLRRN